MVAQPANPTNTETQAARSNRIDPSELMSIAPCAHRTVMSRSMASGLMDPFSIEGRRNGKANADEAPVLGIASLCSTGSPMRFRFPQHFGAMREWRFDLLLYPGLDMRLRPRGQHICAALVIAAVLLTGCAETKF